MPLRSPAGFSARAHQQLLHIRTSTLFLHNLSSLWRCRIAAILVSAYYILSKKIAVAIAYRACIGILCSLEFFCSWELNGEKYHLPARLCFCWWFLLVVHCRKFKVTDLCIIDCSILCNWRGNLFGSFGSSGRHFLAFNLNMPFEYADDKAYAIWIF